MNKGVELAHKGEYEKARQYFDAAIGQDPKAWPLYLNRANVFVHQRKFDLAIQDLNAVLRVRPGVFWYRFCVAKYMNTWAITAALLLITTAS